MSVLDSIHPKTKLRLISVSYTHLCAGYAQSGMRVLVLAHSEQQAQEMKLPEGLQPIAFILITDVIRQEAPDTLAFFDSQGVDLKVISGDDPVTVAAIAKRAGLKNGDRYIDATTITTPEEMQKAVAEYSVFGRVTPQQKKQMVQALQSQKHTVAMTGDGVNDVLALKEADCSIAMAAGSDAAKNIANVVLLDRASSWPASSPCWPCTATMPITTTKKTAACTSTGRTRSFPPVSYTHLAAKCKMVGIFKVYDADRSQDQAKVQLTEEI